jgi:hypothetical protein
VALVVATLLVWALLNTPPPTAPVVRERLSAREVAVLRESQALRRAVGDAIWPDFGRAPIPVQLYNERFGFVLGVAAPRGWDEVTEERIDGEPYYRSANPERQAFAVRIDDTWAGSLPVKDVMDAQTPRQLMSRLGPLGRLVPYRLFFLSTDQYVTLVIHEQFHAFQARSSPRRFETARAANGSDAAYPWERDGYRAAWRDEVALLQSALAAADAVERQDLARQFLRKREERRRGFSLDQAQLDFERQTEWLEGLAKYAELESWRLAATSGYRPLQEMQADPQFHAYSGYDSLWRTERMNMKIGLNMLGDMPFYYTGAMEARLLDAVRPAWKNGFAQSDRHLEELLAEAVTGPWATERR